MRWRWIWSGSTRTWRSLVALCIEELEEFAEEAARQDSWILNDFESQRPAQEALSTAMKTALSEQRAVHQSCVEARRGQSALAKDQELKALSLARSHVTQVEEQVKELRAKNSQLALTLEEAAAACGVEKADGTLIEHQLKMF